MATVHRLMHPTAEERHRESVRVAVLVLLRDAECLRLEDMLAPMNAGDFPMIEDDVSAEDVADALEHLARRGYVGPVWRIASTEGHDAAERAARLLDEGSA